MVGLIQGRRESEAEEVKRTATHLKLLRQRFQAELWAGVYSNHLFLTKLETARVCEMADLPDHSVL